MRELPGKLKDKLDKRKEVNALRSLEDQGGLVDFVSNDYLGFAREKSLYEESGKFLDNQIIQNSGSTGSRLLSGNHPIFDQTEKRIAEYHGSDASLIFNSGYDANLGFFSSVPLRGDLILYDEYAHASIRDGISMSQAKSYKFKHNDLQQLQDLINRHKTQIANQEGVIYVVTESVFSMDGDSPDLKSITNICDEYGCLLVIDEAHAVGVFGQNGAGLVEELNLEPRVFARIVTFGKALGVHGAAVLGTNDLKEFLVNFARSFIYTTAMPPHSAASVYVAYDMLNSEAGIMVRDNLKRNISWFTDHVDTYGLGKSFISSDSAIQSCIIPGNSEVKRISKALKEKGYDVRPILSPTVPESEERLRFCIHSFNTKEEINGVLLHLSKYLSLK